MGSLKVSQAGQENELEMKSAWEMRDTLELGGYITASSSGLAFTHQRDVVAIMVICMGNVGG